MNEIEHDGKTYILKSQVESIIKDRVSKVAQRASEYENAAKSLSHELETMKGKQASYDVLAEQVVQLKSELEQSNTKFQRFQSMTKHGISDQELVETIEWVYDKNMKSKPAKEQVDLETWLQSQFENPNDAPIAIRPHIQQITQSRAQPTEEYDDSAIQQPEESVQDFEMPTSTYEPPRTNMGAVPAPEGKDILSRASDPEFYNQNHEAIRKAWYAKFGR
jgi:hypothetical protein